MKKMQNIELDIINEVPNLLNENEIDFLNISRITLAKCQITDSEVSISLLLIDDKIREMNKDFRNKDSITDVLSFAQLDIGANERGYHKVIDMPLMLGDIIINIEQANRQKDSLGNSLDREVAFLYIHGLLHLLKYDHQNEIDEEIMCQLQREISTEYELQKKSNH